MKNYAFQYSKQMKPYRIWNMYLLFMLMQPILIYANVLFTGFCLQYFVCVLMQFITIHVKFNVYINQMYNSAVH